jgi:hypothetical protein
MEHISETRYLHLWMKSLKVPTQLGPLGTASPRHKLKIAEQCFIKIYTGSVTK